MPHLFSFLSSQGVNETSQVILRNFTQLLEKTANIKNTKTSAESFRSSLKGKISGKEMLNKFRESFVKNNLTNNNNTGNNTEKNDIFEVMKKMGAIFQSVMIVTMNTDINKAFTWEFGYVQDDFDTKVGKTLFGLATWASTVVNEWQLFLGEVRKVNENEYSGFRDLCNALQLLLHDCMGVAVESALRDFQVEKGITKEDKNGTESGGGGGGKANIGRLQVEVTNEGTGSSNEIIDSTKLHVEIWDTDDSTYKYNADKNINIKKVNFRMINPNIGSKEPFYDEQIDYRSHDYTDPPEVERDDKRNLSSPLRRIGSDAHKLSINFHTVLFCLVVWNKLQLTFCDAWQSRN
ncbi:uncharacterized protein LOC142355132 [Convolutriloba macropyga]|uniref:uncharacterized protein LOC142355132 n=1 Tax=Convolutriloba macropyga TaxID=536237 RepID=UPI003F51F9E1